jgi:hypothetical protein
MKSRKIYSKKKSKCREYLSKKIGINMKGYKTKSLFVSPVQAIAIQTLKKFPGCKSSKINTNKRLTKKSKILSLQKSRPIKKKTLSLQKTTPSKKLYLNKHKKKSIMTV